MNIGQKPLFIKLPGDVKNEYRDLCAYVHSDMSKKTKELIVKFIKKIRREIRESEEETPFKPRTILRSGDKISEGSD